MNKTNWALLMHVSVVKSLMLEYMLWTFVASPWVYHSFTWCKGMSSRSPKVCSLTLMGIHHHFQG